MPARTWIEIAGYIGSALVLISFLMTSVVKLRLVNMMGSLISCVYSLIIGSYPLAIMNFALILINLYNLWKIRRSQKDYRLVVLEENSRFLSHLMQEYSSDIEACFPGIDQNPAQANLRLLLLNEDTPAGITLVQKEENTAHLLLDYSMPKFRDYSLGPFLAEQLKAMGFERLSYNGPDIHHRKYLEKMQFKQEAGGWVKTLS